MALLLKKLDCDTTLDDCIIDCLDYVCIFNVVDVNSRNFFSCRTAHIALSETILFAQSVCMCTKLLLQARVLLLCCYVNRGD